ncbi:hypothetical protein AQS8620_00561 [Aquimixticola soesokkakensis]|uniref:Twin-arginine translocation pathway signal n=1 Tax=Aquimixticola soesokkakensis TaxID=1519096 RepID=A0A1Y5RP50_9RHOB|nr:DUF1501 domain-containing protein [Aquimixticola soesokkakensis]SLN20907.1 hypothetical protein AQS8620_00561 [Aquimixticola soesokkakensis]
MTGFPNLDRRRFLLGAACSVAAHPLMTQASFAAAPGENRLVVILLRGAMDGLDVVRPVGDPAFGLLRPDLGSLAVRNDSLPLTGPFALHPELAELMPLWNSGELGFINATSTPYRGTRSHFDGQDILETGMFAGVDGSGQSGRDGWLNRALGFVQGAEAQTAIAVGREQSLLLEGPNPAQSWAPDEAFSLSPQAENLLRGLYHDDDLFRDASETALFLTDTAQNGGAMASEMNGMAPDMDMSAQKAATAQALASYAATRLTGDARIASFSVSGWDSHVRQDRTLLPALRELKSAILTLKAGLGAAWGSTTIIAMTEFGRTAAQNGGGGTDHGTGGLAVLAGGAVRGGRVYGDWPGLEESALYERRDLTPTSDVRAHTAWLMASLYGLDRAALEGTVFPGLDMGRDANLLL